MNSVDADTPLPLGRMRTTPLGSPTQWLTLLPVVLLIVWLLTTTDQPAEILSASFLGGLLGARLAQLRRADRQPLRRTSSGLLGQYTLLHEIGFGGMGRVFKARHALLRRPTAVKLLDARKVQPELIHRFEREVQITSQLTNPHTIAIHDFGRTEDDIFWYAMEYVDGLNLEDFVRRFGPLPEGRVIGILRQVCDSLTEAHEVGLIHRDLKPANILIGRRGGVPDFVKVLDFGLVKLPEPDHVESLGAAHMIIGTPQYVSPEAVEDAESVDARSDIYSLGGVGYFLLTGRPVFEHPSVLELCLAHRKEAPEPPSARLGRAIDADLEKIVLRCLAKDPAERPQSMSELRAELTRSPAATTWTRESAVAWWNEHCPNLIVAGTSPALDETANTAILDAVDLVRHPEKYPV